MRPARRCEWQAPWNVALTRYLQLPELTAALEHHLPHPLALFDLENDVGETTNLAEKYPEVVARLTALADKMRRDLGDSMSPR